ncbi:MAG: cation transporting ATPase C-terminal domain-containing protein [Lachnospiraceae bacterium]
MLGTNIGEVITVFTAMMLWHKTPLLSMQLLWINLVTDSLPAIALGMEAVESEVMTQKPKPKSEGLFAHGFGVRIVLQGVMFGLLALFAFMIGEKSTGTVAGGQTMAFAVLALSQVIQAYNMRSEHSLFKIGMFTNKKLNQAALLSIVLYLLLFTPLRIPFGLELLSKAVSDSTRNGFCTSCDMECSKAFGLIKHQH